jgi:hypothetical protein
MRAKIHKEVTFILTWKEAVLLKGLVQNPISEDEGEDVSEFRKDLFELLDKQGVRFVGEDG